MGSIAVITPSGTPPIVKLSPLWMAEFAIG
jgi:hypothetical protein